MWTKKYRLDLVDKGDGLYDRASSGINYVDSSLAFYLELYGHCDATMRDLFRSKLSMLFRHRLRDSAQGYDLPR